MKQMRILKTLNGISDDLIEEASPDNTDTKAKNPIWKPCLAAACAIAVLTAGGVLGYYKFDRSGEDNIKADEATTVVTPGNTGKYSLGGGVNDETGKKEHITVMTTEATRQQKPLYDIYLSSSENEIKAADGKKSVRFTAEVPADASEVFLIGSEDGSRTEMLDNADYAGSGDDITGDGVFSCMLDIDLSEPAEYTFRAEYIHSQGWGTGVIGSRTVDYSLGDKADGWYVLGMVPVIKSKLQVKARSQTYRESKNWGSSKSLYEVCLNYFIYKNLQLNFEYARINDRTQDKHNYNLMDVQLDFRF